MDTLRLMFEIFGIVAGIFIAVSYMPNAIKTVKTKTTKGLSFLQYIFFHIGCLLFVIYGISLLVFLGPTSLGAYGLILCNGLVLIMNSFVIFHMIKEKNFSAKF